MIRPCRTLNLLRLVAVTATLVAGAAAYAAVPQTIAFQGFLTDAGGQPLEVPVNLDIAVYNTASGGTALWSEAHAGVPVSNGVFAVALGSVSPLSGAVARTSPRFIGIRVNGEAELPRTQLSATPFALRAQAADTVTAGINIKRGFASVLSTQVGPEGEANLTCRAVNGGMVAEFGSDVFGDGTLVLQSRLSNFAMLLSEFNSDPLLSLAGFTQSAVIELNEPLDDSVRFPIGGINSVESFNEPGLARDRKSVV